jgi:hypothetical protein
MLNLFRLVYLTVTLGKLQFTHLLASLTRCTRVKIAVQNVAGTRSIKADSPVRHEKPGESRTGQTLQFRTR